MINILYKNKMVDEAMIVFT